MNHTHSGGMVRTEILLVLTDILSRFPVIILHAVYFVKCNRFLFFVFFRPDVIFVFFVFFCQIKIENIVKYSSFTKE